MSYTPEQLQKMQDFKWDDEEESDLHHSDLSVIQRYHECANAICEYVINNLTISHYSDDDTFSLQIPTSVHSLLHDRYDSQWSLDSRLAMFDTIRALLRLKQDDVGFKILAKINEIFPKRMADTQERVMDFCVQEGISLSGPVTAQKEASIKQIELHDEPSLSVVITEKLDFGQATGQRSFSDGQYVTVEITLARS